MTREDLDGLQILDEQQCHSLLQRVGVGRIALTHRALPLILPVTFGYAHPDLIFSVGAGVLAEAAEQSQIVCFQADWMDADTMASWSVSVIGKLAAMTSESDLRLARDLGIQSWSIAEQRFARLTPQVTTGRARGIVL